MKKISFIIFIFFISFVYIYAEFSLEVLYQNKFYTLTLKDTKNIELDKPYNALKDIDASQTHRVMFTSLEKSRLYDLQYVGNKNRFNNIETSLIDTELYRITDIINNFYVDFSLGEYDSIAIHNFFKFNNSVSARLDRIATVMTVKTLIKQSNSNLIVLDIPKKIEKGIFEINILANLTDNEKKFINKIYKLSDDKSSYVLRTTFISSENRDIINRILSKVNFSLGVSFDNSEKIKLFENFVNSLKIMPKVEAFKFLEDFIELNIEVILDNNIMNKWIPPHDLYYNKKADYKSIAYFYYIVLKELGFDVDGYLITKLIPKNNEYSSNKGVYLDEQKLYNNVNSNDIDIERLIKNYYPPIFEDSIFLVAVNDVGGGMWYYSVGTKWIKSGVYGKSERVCAEYSKRGCYFWKIDDNKIDYITTKDNVRWQIFYKLD